ncbi:MAG TPA: type II secretion system F family protein [Gemmataceae bacterium]|nr:type II secretion system F family protein [Gemmataceae bacterium]
MASNGAITAVIFLGITSLTLLVFLVTGGRRSRLDTRLRQLANPDESPAPVDPVVDFARTALPKMGTVLMPKSEDERTKLQTRLVHAGLYGRQAMVVFLGVKVLVMASPAALGLVIGVLGLVPVSHGLIFGCLLGAFGLIGPSFWLDRRKAARQTQFRRALPDALDVMVICLEGGGSLPSAIRRVATELRTAHPLLATELNLVQREIQLGRSAGEALRQFADRSDLEEVRGLASVLLQAEKFGASLANALRVHAETLRTRRVQSAEEMAQKAVVKLLIPTVFFILPALFVAVLGPLGIRIMEVMETSKAK